MLCSSGLAKIDEASGLGKAEVPYNETLLFAPIIIHVTCAEIGE